MMVAQMALSMVLKMADLLVMMTAATMDMTMAVSMVRSSVVLMAVSMDRHWVG